MTKAMFVIVALIVGGVVSAAHSVADEAPISGKVKTIDTAAKTLMLQTTAQGKARDVTIVVKPETKIVKFKRSTEPGRQDSSSSHLRCPISSRAGP
ncbi:MAG: hypothetical protein AUH69_09760 [Actinobacteria bacterium 13_1_40CM_4_65_12]|nr:MAG: hypothetical protein AUH69_09760 [Actinobacteria bacterium 13_1_40CM_4_65_12]